MVAVIGEIATLHVDEVCSGMESNTTKHLGVPQCQLV
jgi:hypothetical protein